MPQIDVSPSVYRRLLLRSLSFEDTPDDVIARLLDADDDDSGRERKAPPVSEPSRAAPPARPGTILPVSAYWVPILTIIERAGGSAAANDVIEALEEQMGTRFTDADRETLNNGEVRWRNRARFARLRMKEGGLLSDTSPRGIWEITDSGRQYLESRS